MPRAEIGSQKYLANKMKSKGLQRLRWWCEPCQKQCRDANGFKCHVQSESHVRQMQIVGEDPKKFISGFSHDFQRDFVALLRTAHGEKFIGANRFYNTYISDKTHVHMNSTKWSSLTEFVKHLGREGIVNVKEDEKDGLMIAWRDTSIEALRRRNAIKEQEAAEARSGASEDKMLEKMARRAREEAEAKAKLAEAKKAEKQSLEAPTAEATADKAMDVEKPKEDEVKTDEDPTPPETAPIKISFGLKMKTAATSKPGLGKTQSIFKRARMESGEQKAAKKVKI